MHSLFACSSHLFLLQRHGSDVDPKYDRLLEIEGEGKSASFIFALIALSLIIYLAYQLFNIKGGMIQRSLQQAKHLSLPSNWLEKNSRLKD
eukprot:scaffold4222_cov115-Cylindrotheca_fusiformis.AAC.3